MKNKFLNVLWVAVMGITAIAHVGCSNQTDLVADKQQEKAGPEGVLISFGLSAEDYGTDTEVGTRGISNAQSGRVIATSTANIGNDLEVLTEVVEEKAPKTRAGSKPVPPQDYRILAYKDGEKVAEWYGNSSNGTNFNNYPSSPALKHLQPGTYKFYVFNHSHMSILSDGTLTTAINIGSRNAFYLAKEITIPNVKKYKLDFVLKPMFARVRTKLKAYYKGAFSGSFNGKSPYKAGTPFSKTINPKTGETTYTYAPADNDGYPYGEFENTPVEVDEGNGIKSYYVISPKTAGNFFLDGTKLSQVSFMIPSGTGARIFGQPAGGENGVKMPNKFKGDVTLEAGKSYILVYTMYKKADYVFKLDNYGSTSVGSILDNKGKIPVALVVDKAKKLAIAIKDLDRPAPWVTNNAYSAATLYPQTAEGLAQITSKYEGLQESHHKSFTKPYQGKAVVRDNEYNFTAFYNTNQLFNDDNIIRYIPGGGEWDAALKYLGIANPSNGFNSSPAVVNSWSESLGYGLQEALFYQVGGTPLNGTYWGAQEWQNYKALTVTATSNGAYFGGQATNTNALVRPFIKY